MKRLLLNGSPRGKDGNSRKILTWMGQGLDPTGVAASIIVDLAPNPTRPAALQAFLDAEEVVFAFPLYTDSMPGIVKAFLESVAGADPARLRGKRIAFVIQAGFPEGIHTETLGHYLSRLCQRLGFCHLGTLRKGGMESIRMLPPKAVAKVAADFVAAGSELADHGGFSAELVRKMAGPRTFGIVVRTILRLVVVSGFGNNYWNRNLKKNGAFDRRFDAPYAGRPSFKGA